MAAKTIDVVIETPRGCRNKYKHDPRQGCFRLGSVLPAGMAFPYDFGFVPGTKAPDGDPLDVLILMDESAYPGVVVNVRMLGVMEAEQTEDGVTVRNDRVIMVAENAHDYQHLRSLGDIDSQLLRELEEFFISYNRTRDKKFKLLKTRGPKAGWKLIKRATRKPRKRSAAAVTRNGKS